MKRIILFFIFPLEINTAINAPEKTTKYLIIRESADFSCGSDSPRFSPISSGAVPHVADWDDRPSGRLSTLTHRFPTVEPFEWELHEYSGRSFVVAKERREIRPWCSCRCRLREEDRDGFDRISIVVQLRTEGNRNRSFDPVDGWSLCCGVGCEPMSEVRVAIRAPSYKWDNYEFPNVEGTPNRIRSRTYTSYEDNLNDNFAHQVNDGMSMFTSVLFHEFTTGRTIFPFGNVTIVSITEQRNAKKIIATFT